MKIEDCFKIGAIIKTRGLKGELQLYVDFEDLELISLSAVFADMAGKLVPFFVESIKYAHNGNAYLFLEDVDSIDKATKLVKKDFYLPNKAKPKRGKKVFSLKDLKGFIAVDSDEGEMGVIHEVQELPQQLIAKVTYKNCEVFFPLNEDIITGIDQVKGIVYVDLPEGLLDIYLE